MNDNKNKLCYEYSIYTLSKKFDKFMKLIINKTINKRKIYFDLNLNNIMKLLTVRLQ